MAHPGTKKKKKTPPATPPTPPVTPPTPPAYTPKDILDKWATDILQDYATYEDNGVTKPNGKLTEYYTPEKYSPHMVLWKPPANCIRLEFENDDKKENERIISEIESNAKILGIDYCISRHKGCKSPYFNSFNFTDVLTPEDMKIARNIMIGYLLPARYKEALDKSNLGWTWSPVIGHKHWKKKYHGAVHEIIRGTNPLEHSNKFPKEVLKALKKIKEKHKNVLFKTLQDSRWVEDFLINYCTTHKLPEGNRHRVIEKNLCALLFQRTDKEQIKNCYLLTQRGDTEPDTTESWMNAIANDKYVDVRPDELFSYIRDYNIEYIIPNDATGIPEEAFPDDDDMRILSDPKLMFNIIEEVHKQGVVGEDSSIIVLINKTNLRLVKHHDPTSSNMLVSDLTGSGKDILVKTTLRVMLPEKDLIHRTRFSDKAIEYYCEGKDKTFTFDGKVLYLEDPEDELLKSQAFRVLSSGQNKVDVVRDQKILELTVKGKPVIEVTSMNASIDEEGGRRWDGIKIDTTPELTELVIEKKLQLAEGIIKKPMPPMVKAIQKLKPYEVVIPYATQLLPYFKENRNIKMRTQVGKLLDYIKSSAVFHQYQREKDEQGRIIANDFDYMYGKFMFIALGDAEGGVLNIIERRLLEILKLAQRPLSYTELVSRGLGRSKQWLYDHDNDLMSRGLIAITEEWDNEANKHVQKMSNTFGYSSVPLPKGLVLFGFKGDLGNQNKEGFKGFNGFINILKELNENRIQHGLSKIDFDDIDDKKIQMSLTSQENQEKQYNLPVGGILKPLYNHIKPPLKSSHLGQDGESKIVLTDDLRKFCEKIDLEGMDSVYPKKQEKDDNGE